MAKDMASRAKIAQMLQEVMTDINDDMHHLDGQPFNGAVVSKIIGVLAAEVYAIAAALSALLELEATEHDEVEGT